MNVSHTTWGFAARLWDGAAETALAWWRSVYLGAVVLVLLLSPSSYRGQLRARMAYQLYVQTGPVLLGFTALAALLCAVITRIVIVTALSYGLSRYALEMVVRVLVLELIPLTACLFVAMRCTIPNGSQLIQMRLRGHADVLQRRGLDPVRSELLPRAVGGLFACLTLAALSCVVALVTVYLSVYGFTLAGLPAYTRLFGHVFSPVVTLVFTLKTAFFSLAVALIPLSSGWYSPLQRLRHEGRELGGLTRMFAVLLVIEILSLMGNYY
ncbi:MlaE family ABC transporter permease [Comamonas antarctica]|uniref:ABC transporter permease n=1 Tax=Comamonas antarctica TaxID=2743470 RepID=A0A6N1X6E3_9BURK|nr:ABC transporter permease [Comamonas antarctica]QKV53415.1 ABC transporter permease [Comamonas antarctica]